MDFDSLYSKLFSLWVSKFGDYPLGVIGRYYLVGNFNNSSFEVLRCHRDRRCSCGYKYLLYFVGSYDEILSFINSHDLCK